MQEDNRMTKLFKITERKKRSIHSYKLNKNIQKINGKWSIVDNVEKLQPLYIAGGNVNGAATMKTVLQSLS